MAVGSRSRDGSALEAASLEIGCGYFTVGDAGLARRALDAVREAFDVAITFDKPEVHKDAVKPKKIVFVTGATVKMGQETMKQLLARSSRFKVRILARCFCEEQGSFEEIYVSGAGNRMGRYGGLRYHFEMRDRRIVCAAYRRDGISDGR